MRWCGSILKMAGSLAQASPTAWKGVRHRSALRCLATLSAATKARRWARPERFQVGIAEDLDGGVLHRPVHPLGLAVGWSIEGRALDPSSQERPARPAE